MLLKLYLDSVNEDDLYTEKCKCSECNRNSVFKMTNNGLRITLYGLPLISAAPSHSLKCISCGSEKKLKRKDYRKKLSEKLLQIKNSLTLSEYEKAVCNPKNLKIIRRIIKVLVTGWIAKTFSDVYFDMIISSSVFDVKTIVSAAITGLFSMAIYIPFAMSVNGLYLALKKRSLYKKCLKSNQ